MKRVTVKKIREWLKTLEENRYKKIYLADARRIAWFVNNFTNEDAEMPNYMIKRWKNTKYGKEKYLAEKYTRSLQKNEAILQKLKNIIKEEIFKLI